MLRFGGSFWVIFLFTFLAIGWADNKDAEKPYIDYLTLEYLSVEQNLWSRINSNSDSNTLYSMVQNEHQRFISNNFGVSTNTHDIYIPSGILVDSLKQVNHLYYNTSILLNSGSIETINIYNVHTILRNAIAYSENLFREAIQAEFWEKGKNVSLHLKLKFQEFKLTSANQSLSLFPIPIHFQYVQHCHELETSPITIESEFQLIYNYYKDVRAALLKTYILTQLSHMLININNKG